MAEKMVQMVPRVSEGRPLADDAKGSCVTCTQSTMGYCRKHQIFVNALDNCWVRGLTNEYQRSVRH